MSRLKEMDRSLKVKSITDKLQTSGVSLDKILDSLKRGNLAKRKAGLKSGGRAAFKHGKWVKATGVPHADIDKYVDKQTGKEIDDKPGSRFRKEGSTLEMGKKRGGRRAGQPTRDPGKKKFNPGKKFKVVILKSLGGRVGAATHGFNKKILRTD